LRWVRIKRCPWDIIMCSYAAENGYLEGCIGPVEMACIGMKRNPLMLPLTLHLEISQRTRMNGCRWWLQMDWTSCIILLPAKNSCWPARLLNHGPSCTHLVISIMLDTVK